MCGRAAQTVAAVRSASRMLGVESTSATTASTAGSQDDNNNNDNYNMSPGMDGYVFWLDRQSTTGEEGTIRMDRKTWGLVPRSGTETSPLPVGMNHHFSNLMFNARSDTLFEKPTFARLVSAGKTCLIALDGFFEWKTETGKKQPYFVYRKSENEHDRNGQGQSFLLMAGLWTSVQTGRSEDPTLDTFTILTMESCSKLEWLHSRMPVSIWDRQLALQWLRHPSQQMLRRLEVSARNDPLLAWHAVNPQMSNMKFRSKDAIKPLKIRTVDSFFTAMASQKKAVSNKNESEKKVKNIISTDSKKKRPISSSSSSSPRVTKSPPKKAKTLFDFFPQSKG